MNANTDFSYYIILQDYIQDNKIVKKAIKRLLVYYISGTYGLKINFQFNLRQTNFALNHFCKKKIFYKQIKLHTLVAQNINTLINDNHVIYL